MTHQKPIIYYIKNCYHSNQLITLLKDRDITDYFDFEEVINNLTLNKYNPYEYPKMYVQDKILSGYKIYLWIFDNVYINYQFDQTIMNLNTDIYNYKEIIKHYENENKINTNKIDELNKINNSLKLDNNNLQEKLINNELKYQKLDQNLTNINELFDKQFYKFKQFINNKLGNNVTRPNTPISNNILNEHNTNTVNKQLESNLNNINYNNVSFYTTNTNNNDNITIEKKDDFIEINL